MMGYVIVLLGFIVYYTVGRRYQSTLLVAISLYVYWLVARWSIVPIAILSSLIVIFGSSLAKHHSKWLLITPIVIVIFTFILLREFELGINLPIGISVLSFTGISYLVDQYRKPIRYTKTAVLSYLLFFPKIFAGPIERADNFINGEIHRLQWSKIYNGVKYLIFAAFCKFIVGDMMASTEFDAYGVGLLFQMLTYGIGFFFDFWAYTMMAIGVGELFGYHLSVSFYRPYYAGTFKEFWHRWNITLGAWLRDYIYIPCGGNHLRLPLWILVIFLVFVISGLWHGATIPFIIWGIANACLICLEKIIIKPRMKSRFFRFCYGVIVALIIALLWQLFIVDSMSDLRYRFQKLTMQCALDIMPLVQFAFCLLAMIVLTSNQVYNLVRYESSFKRTIIAEVTVLSLMLATLIIFNCPMSFNFFYFRF